MEFFKNKKLSIIQLTVIVVAQGIKSFGKIRISIIQAEYATFLEKLGYRTYVGTISSTKKSSDYGEKTVPACSIKKNFLAQNLNKKYQNLF